ncbi:hypothetical protein [Aeromonas enteropelogenes]|uniref:hypothetical protein n=1 Tax=Aeromonas enteropelogenes TaxID=29489 RepID=UPI003BA168F5
MYLYGKARYALSLMSFAIRNLNRIKDDRDSTASLIANIPPDVAFVLITDVENLFNKVDGLFNAEFFSKNKQEDYDVCFAIWMEYIELLCKVMKAIIFSPECLARFFTSEKSFLTYCSILFDDLYAQMHFNGKPISFRFEVNNQVYNNVVTALALTEEHFEDIVDASRKSSYFTAFERLNSATASKLNNVVESKINDVEHAIQGMSEAFENERASIGHTLSQFDTNSSEMLNDYFNRLKSIEATEVDIKTLFDDAVKRASGILKLASQEGMASAFQKRSDTLKWLMLIWGSVFIFSLATLGYVSHDIISVVLAAKDESWFTMLAKLTTSLPFIWGAWFSAKQYNNVNRLREDYAYKVAVAMAYHGYKDEATEINSEMSGKLLENIIVNFAQNPVRLYGNDNSASMLESLLKDNKISEIITAIKGKG